MMIVREYSEGYQRNFTATNEAGQTIRARMSYVEYEGEEGWLVDCETEEADGETYKGHKRPHHNAQDAINHYEGLRRQHV